MIMLPLYCLDPGLCVRFGDGVVCNSCLPFWYIIMVFHLQMSQRLRSYPGFEVFKQHRPLCLCMCASTCASLSPPDEVDLPHFPSPCLCCQITMATCWNVNTLLYPLCIWCSGSMPSLLDFTIADNASDGGCWSMNGWNLLCSSTHCQRLGFSSIQLLSHWHKVHRHSLSSCSWRLQWWYNKHVLVFNVLLVKVWQWFFLSFFISRVCTKIGLTVWSL